MIKVIVFDFDGVLVESVDIKTKAFAHLFAHHGKNISDRVVAHHLANTGVSRFEKFKYVYDEILQSPLYDAEFQRLCREFSRLVAEEVAAAPAVPGAMEFLEATRGKYILFVASATPEQELQEIVARRGMESYFTKVFGAPLPKREAARQSLESCACTGREALFVGDARSDYDAAMANGMWFVGRDSGGDVVFEGLNCQVLPDLTALEDTIVAL